MGNGRNEEHNNGQHIDRIVRAQVCEKHEAGLGTPCWTVESAYGYLRAICNERALLFGARGEVTPYQKPLAPNSKKKEHTR